MFLIEANSNFKLEHIPNAIPQPDDFVFIYDGNKIGLTEENELPRFKGLKISGNFYGFAKVNHHPCLLLDGQASTNLKFIEAKLNYTLFSKEFYQAMAIG